MRYHRAVSSSSTADERIVVDKFYSKKLEGLRIIRDHLLEIDKIYADLTKLESMQPSGDPEKEYRLLNDSLSVVRAQLECLFLPVKIMADGEK